MGRVFFGGGKVGMEGPTPPLMLAHLSEGSIVKINEDSSPVEFIVAKHNYEEVLNGTGKTLLVRKDALRTIAWNTAGTNVYDGSSIDVYLNGTYMQMFADSLQQQIGKTKFYCAKGNKDATVVVMERSAFLLSMSEVCQTHSNATIEGSAISIFDTDEKRIAYRNGTAVIYWLRSTDISGTDRGWNINSYGIRSLDYVTTNTRTLRPCFTLPSTVKIDESTMIIS